MEVREAMEDRGSKLHVSAVGRTSTLEDGWTLFVLIFVLRSPPRGYNIA